MSAQPALPGAVNPPKASRFRLSTRVMMAFIAVVGMGFWGLSRWHRSHAPNRRDVSGWRVTAPWEIIDLLREPQDHELLRRAKRIDYRGKSITDADLADLVKHADPLVLNLDDSLVTDDGLAHIAGMKNLEFLDLRGTGVTDAGLVHLKSMKNLRAVSLKETRTSSNGLDELQRALPKLKIWRP